MTDPIPIEHVVASTGGECVCFFDCQLGRVTAKYTHPGEEFYTLDWLVHNGAVVVGVAGKHQMFVSPPTHASITLASLYSDRHVWQCEVD